MNEQVRQTLVATLSTADPATLDDPIRVEALLAQICGPNRRELAILTAALRDGVMADLRAPGAGIPEILINRLARRLEANQALTPEAARWAAESWALALNVIAQPFPPERTETIVAPTQPTRSPTVIAQPPAADAPTRPPARPPSSTSEQTTRRPSASLPPDEQPTAIFTPQPAAAGAEVPTTLLDSPSATPAGGGNRNLFLVGGTVAAFIAVAVGIGMLGRPPAPTPQPETPPQGMHEPTQRIDGSWQLHFTNSNIAYDGVLQMQGMHGTLQLRFVDAEGRQVTIVEQMRLWAFDRGLIAIGSAPVHAESGNPEPNYSTDNLVIVPEASGGVRVANCDQSSGKMACVPVQITGHSGG